MRSAVRGLILARKYDPPEPLVLDRQEVDVLRVECLVVPDRCLVRKSEVLGHEDIDD